MLISARTKLPHGIENVSVHSRPLALGTERIPLRKHESISLLYQYPSYICNTFCSYSAIYSLYQCPKIHVTYHKHHRHHHHTLLSLVHLDLEDVFDLSFFVLVARMLLVYDKLTSRKIPSMWCLILCYTFFFHFRSLYDSTRLCLRRLNNEDIIEYEMGRMWKEETLLLFKEIY